MNQEVIEYLLLITALIILLLAYYAYIIYDTQNKINYYKTTISYETNWDKYHQLVKSQKKVIRKKKLQLRLLKILMFLKGL